jgi:hypothetical protein
MKKLLSNLLFLGMATLGFAQTPFTAQTVQDINKRFIENPTNDETAPDYVLTGSEGQKINMEQLNQMFPNVKHLTWETSDMTIKQYGKVAIVIMFGVHTSMNSKRISGVRFQRIIPILCPLKRVKKPSSKNSSLTSAMLFTQVIKTA